MSIKSPLLTGGVEVPDVISRLESQEVTLDPISQWLLQNKCTVPLDPRHNEETFTDQNGVLRYVDNWLPAAPKANFNILNNTGCIEKTLDFIDDPDPSMKGKKPEIRFLTDWKALWDYFDNDNVDEIATQIPLLRIFVEFFFHQRTSHFVVFLLIYLLAYQTTLTILYDVMPKIIRPIAVLFYVCEVVVYMAMRVLFKGSCFGEPRLYQNISADPVINDSAEEDTSSSSSKKNKKKKGLIYRYSVHWSSSFVHLIKHSWKELKLLCTKEGRGKRSVTKKTLTYYELLNISMKFLIRMDGFDLKKVNFNRRTYRACLLFILFIYPLVVYFSMYCPYYKYYSICPKGTLWYTGDADNFCRWYTWDMIFSLVGIMPALLNYMFGGSVLIALVSLAYGCEINYRLTHCWIFRFKGLQRLDPPPPPPSGGSDANEGGTTLKIVSSNDVQGNIAISSGDAAIDSKITELLPLIAIDAREHYMFLREYMNQAGKLWSFGLVGIFVLYLFVMIIMLYFVYLGGTTLDLVRLIISLLIKFVVLYIYPIVSISHANNFVFDLQEIFRIAAPEDFTILGGKAKWMDLFESLPAAWTVFGIWITYEKLFAFIWTIVSSAAAVGIAVITTNLGG